MCVGKFIAMDPERQGGQGVSAYLTICKDVQGHASLRCTMKVDAVFEHCWSPADGRKALDGPDLIFTFAYLKPSLKAEWEHLRIYCSILDKRSHFAIENFLFTGPASDRMKYGPTFLDAICIFWVNCTIAQIIRHQRKLDGICNLRRALSATSSKLQL